MGKPQTFNLTLGEITADPGVQQRADGLDEAWVEELAAVCRSAKDRRVPFKDKPVCFYDGKAYWLAAGFHRVAAAGRAGVKELACTVLRGGRADALMLALGDNADHGKPRSPADKRKAVVTAYTEFGGDKPSARKIAELCRVSDSLAAEVIRELRGAAPDAKKAAAAKKANESKAAKKNAVVAADRAAEEPTTDTSPVVSPDANTTSAADPDTEPAPERGGPPGVPDLSGFKEAAPLAAPDAAPDLVARALAERPLFDAILADIRRLSRMVAGAADGPGGYFLRNALDPRGDEPLLAPAAKPSPTCSGKLAHQFRPLADLYRVVKAAAPKMRCAGRFADQGHADHDDCQAQGWIPVAPVLRRNAAGVQLELPAGEPWEDDGRAAA